MKRMIALILALATALSLTACGGSAPAETKPTEIAPIVTEASTEAPTTVPTLSHEEILYNSLPERMRQAVDIGIVELSQLEDLNRECTIGEAAQMLQNAYTLHNGIESRLMADVLALDYVNEPAYLGWIGRLPSAMQMEVFEPGDYESYPQWMEYMVKKINNPSSRYQWNFIFPASVWLYIDNDSKMAEGGMAANMEGYDPFDGLTEGYPLLEECRDHGFLIGATAIMYDQTNGDKIIECDTHYNFDVEKILTIGEMVEMALRTYYAFFAGYDLAPYEECVACDDTIITAELLNKETDLPDASCAELPSSWHGVQMEDLDEELRVAGGYHYDREVYEYEIQAVKDAGFNYIGLQIDFSWFQAGSTVFRTDAQDGQLDRNRLRKLDQILAWCMERDIHLDIRCTGLGGIDPTGKDWTASQDTAKKHAKLWGVLAQRYADISNTYLSFTLVDNTLQCWNDKKADGGFESLYKNESQAAELLKPSVEAIRAVSPDRCIIADISFWNATGKDMAKLGVALSADLSANNDFFLIPYSDFTDQKQILEKQWTDDAGAMIESKNYGMNILNIAAAAEENGLGFMISGWGEIATTGRPETPNVRYSDETYSAFLTDMAETLGSHGFGWCYEEWYGENGVVFSAPMTLNVSYQQIGDYPMYYDTAMLGFFKEVNGVQ